MFKKSTDPDEEERRRRAHLNQLEGLVVEIVETGALRQPASEVGLLSSRKSSRGASEFGSRRLVRYSYAMSGVTYETAQDVTGLEERLCLERLAAGQPARVKL